MKNREELGERGSMGMYKDVKKRILAGVLAALMVVSTLSIGSNLFAEYSPDATGTLVDGQYAQVSTAATDYQKLESATMKVDMNNTQSVSYTVSVYQNLTDASNPTSGELRYTSSRLTIDGTQESATPTDLQVDLKGANIYLSAGETYAVVYTFDSVSDAIYYHTTVTVGMRKQA